MRACRHIAIAAGILLLSACGDSISTPVPQPLPSQPEADRVRISTPDEPADPTLVTGLPGSVEGEGVVELRDTATGSEATTASTPGGTFSVTLVVGEGALIEARYGDGQGRFSAWAPLTRRSRGEPAPNLEPSDGPEPVSAPDAQGQVVVSNVTDQGVRLFDVPAQTEVVVSNLDNGDAVSTQSDGEGVFSVTLSAATGDAVAIFLAASDDASVTSDFLVFTVP